MLARVLGAVALVLLAAGLLLAAAWFYGATVGTLALVLLVLGVAAGAGAYAAASHEQAVERARGRAGW